jgi:hypothetical protein
MQKKPKFENAEKLHWKAFLAKKREHLAKEKVLGVQIVQQFEPIVEPKPKKPSKSKKKEVKVVEDEERTWTSLLF